MSPTKALRAGDCGDSRGILVPWLAAFRVIGCPCGHPLCVDPSSGEGESRGAFADERASKVNTKSVSPPACAGEVQRTEISTPSTVGEQVQPAVQVRPGLLPRRRQGTKPGRSCTSINCRHISTWQGAQLPRQRSRPPRGPPESQSRNERHSTGQHSKDRLSSRSSAPRHIWSWPGARPADSSGPGGVRRASDRLALSERDGGAARRDRLRRGGRSGLTARGGVASRVRPPMFGCRPSVGDA